MTTKPEDFEPPRMTDDDVRQAGDEVVRRWVHWTQDQRLALINRLNRDCYDRQRAMEIARSEGAA